MDLPTLTELGRALGLPLGTLVTGPLAVEAANELRDRLEAAEAKVARAWDEGWQAGCNDQQYGDDNAEPWTPNPYATESAFAGRSTRPIPPDGTDPKR